MSNLAISVLGAGRMGREILQAMAAQPQHFQLAGVWARTGSRIDQQALAKLFGEAASAVTPSGELRAALRGADVAIDFTLPAATAEVVAAARHAGKALVCGVSGIAPVDLQSLRDAATDIPVFFARNMSIGIALLERSVSTASAVLGSDFEIRIDDLHHAKKRDAPSGTALLLGEAAAAARGQDFASAMHYAPDQPAAMPAPGAIAFRVRREGEHPGAHQVSFANASETLTFGHEVADRRVFADGALRAARWLHGRAPGFYGMQDLLADAGNH